MHFTRLGAYADGEVPIIARGEGCYVWDSHGKRYLDGLSGLFTVQVGHGRPELAEAAARQAETLGFRRALSSFAASAPPSAFTCLAAASRTAVKSSGGRR